MEEVREYYLDSPEKLRLVNTQPNSVRRAKAFLRDGKYHFVTYYLLAGNKLFHEPFNGSETPSDVYIAMLEFANQNHCRIRRVNAEA